VRPSVRPLRVSASLRPGANPGPGQGTSKPAERVSLPTRLMPDIQRPERRLAISAFLCLFGILTAHTLTETARDALFLAHLPAARLPWVYLGIAASSALMVRVTGNRPRGGKKPVTLPVALLFAAGIDVGFFALTSFRTNVVFYALYLWSGIFGSWAVLTFWYLLARVIDVGRAKRIYPVVGAGAIAGAIFGAAFARGVAYFAPAQLLLVVAAGVLVITALGPTLVFARLVARAKVDANADDEEPAATSVMTDVGEALRTRHVQKILAGALLSNLAATLIDFLFKSYAASHHTPEELGAYFATTAFVFNVAALLVQLFLAGSLLRLLGPPRALQVMPVLFVLIAFAGGSPGIAAWIWLPLLYKGADSALRPSLLRTATELLELPLSDSVRRGAKVLIDLFGQRVGQALASVGILGITALGLQAHAVRISIVVVSVVWVVLNARVKAGYLDLFRTNLREGLLGSSQRSALDLDALETLLTALNSPNEAEVVASLDLLRDVGKLQLVPDVILFHPSTEVVLKAMPWMVERRREAIKPILDRLVISGAPQVRAAALRQTIELVHDCDPLRAYLDDPDVEVRTTALVGLVAHGDTPPEEAQRALDRALSRGDTAGRVALVDAMAWHPSTRFVPILRQLASDADARVRAGVARAIAKLHEPELIGILVGLLAKADVRDDVHQAMGELGDDACRQLSVFMGDARWPFAVRRQLPAAIAASGSAQAAPVLVDRLAVEEDMMMRTRILRALRTLMSAADPHDRPPALDRGILETLLVRYLDGSHIMRDIAAQLDAGAREDSRRATAAHDLLRSFIGERMYTVQENVFLVLGLLDPREDYALLLRGLRGNSPALRANSQELLENVLTEHREQVLQLLEDPPPPSVVDYAGTLRKILEAPSSTARAIAAYHVGELGLSGLRPDVMNLKLPTGDSMTDLVGQVRRSLPAAT
jgi:AAA family ATP:ADP antiporter